MLSGHSSKWPAVHCKPVWGVHVMVCFFSTAPLGSVYSKCARASKCDDGILLRSIMLESVCCCWLFSLLMERKSAPHDNISCKKDLNYPVKEKVKTLPPFLKRTEGMIYQMFACPFKFGSTITRSRCCTGLLGPI